MPKNRQSFNKPNTLYSIFWPMITNVKKVTDWTYIKNGVFLSRGISDLEYNYAGNEAEKATVTKESLFQSGTRFNFEANLLFNEMTKFSALLGVRRVKSNSGIVETGF